MDFRMYDNALGRFHNIDKMTDIMPSLSPYRFAFNNPVLWGDPTGLLESGGGGEEIKTIYFPDVVIIGHRKSSDERPASFNYSLINWSQVDNRKRPTLEQYNKHNGTNYSSFDDYYYNEHYKPAQNKMIQKRNQAGKTVIGTLLVMGTAGVGTAYALPVLVACSPAIQSTVAALATNPTVVSIQSFMYGGLSEYAGANMLANTIGQTVANGGDLSKVNPVSVVASGFNGFAPVLASSAIDLSSEARNDNKVFKNGKTITNNILLNYLGNGAKNGLQLPRSAMSNASFATYQGMINTGVEAVGTGVTNKMNE
jgi:hypothetical protein